MTELDPERLEHTKEVGDHYTDFLAVLNAFNQKMEEAAAGIVIEIYDEGPEEMVRFVTVMASATLGVIQALSQWSGVPPDQLLANIGRQQANMNAEVQALLDEARAAQDEADED